MALVMRDIESRLADTEVNEWAVGCPHVVTEVDSVINGGITLTWRSPEVE